MTSKGEGIMFTWSAVKLAFTTWKGFLKILPYLLVIAVLTYGSFKIYGGIFARGAASIQVQWDKETDDYKRAIAALQDAFRKKETTHLLETTRINDELAETKRLHDVELANAAAEFERRLLVSANRAEIYKRQAASGPDQCLSLAGHTARLDTSLEEGRSLVEEFRRTLGLRDRQLREVGNQLLADRELYAEPIGK